MKEIENLPKEAILKELRYSADFWNMSLIVEDINNQNSLYEYAFEFCSIHNLTAVSKDVGMRITNFRVDDSRKGCLRVTISFDNSIEGNLELTCSAFKVKRNGQTI